MTAKAMIHHEWAVLAHFARWAVCTSAFMGVDLCGSEVQEKALKLGLIVEAPNGYDPERHGPHPDFSPGDKPFYEFARWLWGDHDAFGG